MTSDADKSSPNKPENKAGDKTGADRAKRLPFEPMRLKRSDRSSVGSPKANDRQSHDRQSQNRGKAARPTSPVRSQRPSAPSATRVEQSATATPARPDTGIPEVVSRRMLSRMAVLCGVPTLMAVILFLVSYQVVIHHWLNIPNIAVVLVSMACFGLGVLGLTYGALSASWEESEAGSWLGWSEFQTNFERMTAAWREAGEKRVE